MAKVKKAEQVNAVQDLKTIMNHPMVILIVSPDDGRIWAANTAAAQFYGWSIERLSQMHINELNALLHEKSQTALELMLSQQRGFFECQHKLKDGQRRDVELHIAPILSGIIKLRCVRWLPMLQRVNSRNGCCVIVKCSSGGLFSGFPCR